MRYSRAQVGNARPAADPHLIRTADPAGQMIDNTGDRFDAGGGDRDESRSLRGVRARQLGRTIPHDAIAFDDSPDTRADIHHAGGSPDARRNEIGEKGYAAGEIGEEPMPVVYRNERRVQLIDAEPPPARPRLGWTGADPAHTPFYRRPFVMRPFDKNMAEHPRAVDKVPMPAPRARTSDFRLTDLPASRPYAGGGTGTRGGGGGASVGNPQPNTFRIMPNAWDALLVNVGGPAASSADPDPAAAAAASQRARSFRL